MYTDHARTRMQQRGIRADAIEVTRLFGSDARSFASAPPDASQIAERLRLTHEELAAVLATRFVRADGTAVRLRTTRAEGALQRDREVVEGLTVDALGRMHRFARLWRRTPASTARLSTTRQWQSRSASLDHADCSE